MGLAIKRIASAQHSDLTVLSLCVVVLEQVAAPCLLLAFADTSMHIMVEVCARPCLHSLQPSFQVCPTNHTYSITAPACLLYTSSALQPPPPA